MQVENFIFTEADHKNSITFSLLFFRLFQKYLIRGIHVSWNEILLCFAKRKKKLTEATPSHFVTYLSAHFRRRRRLFERSSLYFFCFLLLLLVSKAKLRTVVNYLNCCCAARASPGSCTIFTSDVFTFGLNSARLFFFFIRRMNPVVFLWSLVSVTRGFCIMFRRIGWWTHHFMSFFSKRLATILCLSYDIHRQRIQRGILKGGKFLAR